MRLIDFNIHPVPVPNLAYERDSTAYDLRRRLVDLDKETSAAGIARGNVMILDSDFLRRRPASDLRGLNRHRFKVTVMLDPRDVDSKSLIQDNAHLIDGIKFHPYLLDLQDREFGLACDIANIAAEHGLWVAVDCSYGTLRIYQVSGVRLVIALAEVVQGPIVALHGGGPAVLDLLGVAAVKTNVFLDTSFSIPYWLGSSVEADFAFSIRKLGAARWLFGSDHPYVSMAEAPLVAQSFLRRHGFDLAAIAQVMGHTAEALFDSRYSRAPLAH